MLLILLLLWTVLLVSSGQLTTPEQARGLVADIPGCAISPLVLKETGPGYATESFNHIPYNLTEHE